MQHRHPRLDSINERALDVVCLVIDPFVSSIPDRPGMRRIQDQLIGASGGIGANLEEAPAASSRKEFVRFCEIALRESRETNFWLKVCQRTGVGEQSLRSSLLTKASRSHDHHQYKEQQRRRLILGGTVVHVQSLFEF